MNELLLWWANLGLPVTIVLAIATITVFLLRRQLIKQPTKKPLPKGKRGALSQKEKADYLKSLEPSNPDSEDSLTKEEQLIQKLLQKDNVELEGAIEAYGTKIKIKKTKPKPPIPFEKMAEEEIENLDASYQQNMKKLIDDVRPPQRNEEKTTQESPEKPKEGWESYLENQGVIAKQTPKQRK